LRIGYRINLNPKLILKRLIKKLIRIKFLRNGLNILRISFLVWKDLLRIYKTDYYKFNNSIRKIIGINNLFILVWFISSKSFWLQVDRPMQWKIVLELIRLNFGFLKEIIKEVIPFLLLKVLIYSVANLRVRM
jgi:hypothetical protein